MSLFFFAFNILKTMNVNKIRTTVVKVTFEFLINSLVFLSLKYLEYNMLNCIITI